MLYGSLFLASNRALWGACLSIGIFFARHASAQDSKPPATEQASVTTAAAAPLPAAPSAILADPQQALPPGSLSGTVVDADGDAIPGAKVMLTTSVGTTVVMAGEDGIYTFPNVKAQTWKISVLAAGFTSNSVSGTLNPGQDLIVEPITLGAGANVQVEVGALTQEELSLQEIHLEEQQRLLGVVPNFYVTYNWNAPPMTTRQKYNMAWHTLIDPVNLLINAGIAGFQQANNDLAGYGSGPTGYLKRYGAANADFAAGTFLGGAVFPAIFHQDPRYFYMGPERGGVAKRLFYALSTAVIAKGDNGKWQPSYSGILGDFSAGAVSNIYYPSTDRHGLGLTLQNGLLSCGLDGLSNVIQEFVLKHVTPHVQSSAVAAPAAKSDASN